MINAIRTEKGKQIIMNIVAIIPSRYGSTRFEGKPLALISGKPMIQQVYERVKRAEGISDVLVATDDPRISDAVKGFRGEVVMTSGEHISGTDRVAEAVRKMGLSPDDIVVNVQGDQPLLDPRCVDEVVAPLQPHIRDSGCEMSTLAFRILDENEITSPKDVKVVFDNNGIALYFSRSAIPHGRDASARFDTYKHLGVYAYTQRFLKMFRALPEGRLEAIEKLEQLRVIEHGHKIRVKITEYDSPEVDLPEDIGRIERLMSEA